MGTKADAHIERLVEVQRHWRAKLMHRLALQADEDGERVAMLFDSDAFGVDAIEQTGETIFQILHKGVFVAAEGQMDQARAVLALGLPPGNGTTLYVTNADPVAFEQNVRRWTGDTTGRVRSVTAAAK